jgi:hypothetical protein
MLTLNSAALYSTQFENGGANNVVSTPFLSLFALIRIVHVHPNMAWAHGCRQA